MNRFVKAFTVFWSASFALVALSWCLAQLALWLDDMLGENWGVAIVFGGLVTAGCALMAHIYSRSRSS